MWAVIEQETHDGWSPYETYSVISIHKTKEQAQASMEVSEGKLGIVELSSCADFIKKCRDKFNETL